MFRLSKFLPLKDSVAAADDEINSSIEQKSAYQSATDSDERRAPSNCSHDYERYPSEMSREHPEANAESDDERCLVSEEFSFSSGYNFRRRVAESLRGANSGFNRISGRNSSTINSATIKKKRRSSKSPKHLSAKEQPSCVTDDYQLQSRSPTQHMTSSPLRNIRQRIKPWVGAIRQKEESSIAAGVVGVEESVVDFVPLGGGSDSFDYNISKIDKPPQSIGCNPYS